MNQYLLSVMKGQKNSFWAKLMTYLLWPLSLIYGIGVILHRLGVYLKNPYRSPKPVISIGNLTLGGVGKTPLVIWLAQRLQEKGIKPAILIRGYMPESTKVSDEVKMLYEQLPFISVLAGADRVANIKKTVGHVPVDVFICDDAFQHWALKRDLNIVAIDATNPFGNGFLFPAGVLREPISALRRASVIVLTKANQLTDLQGLYQTIHRINPRALVVESCHKSTDVVGVFERNVPHDRLRGQRVVGFCAIGDPHSFESVLKNKGASIVNFFSYRDHHVYTRKDIKRLLDFCRSRDVHILVTTHKDAVKLYDYRNLFEDFHLYYVLIQLEVTKGSDEFLKRVMAICQR